MAQLSSKLDWPAANPLWAAALNPVLANRLINGQQINNIILTANTPFAVYHSLGIAPQGWFVVDNTVNCYVIRTQPFNAKTITIEASATTTIAIWVY